MKPKIILCLAVVLSGVLFGFSTTSQWPNVGEPLTPPPLNAVLTHIAVVATDASNEPLNLLLSKSDLVVLGAIANEPTEITLESGVPNYICAFQVEDVLKGDAKLQGRAIAANIVRLEMEAKDKHPLVKKGGECILFLKTDKSSTPTWVTADFWFGVQYPSPRMARELKQMASKK
jgi:hypothetical protein